MLLLPPEQFIGKSVQEVLPDWLSKQVMENLKKVLDTKTTQIFTYHLEIEGSVHYYEARLVHFLENHVLAIIRNITDRARAEEAILEAEKKYRTMVEQIPVAVYTDAVDASSTTLFISPQIEWMTGYTAEEWIANPSLWINMVHPEDRPKVEREHVRTNQTGDPFQMEYRLVRRDGEPIWVRDESTLLHDANGIPSCWQGVILDITRQKLAEQARLDAENELRGSEQRYRQLFDLSPDAIVVLSEGNILLVNQAAMTLMGAGEPEEIIGRQMLDFVTHENDELVTEPTLLGFAEGKAIPVTEEKFLRLDGTPIDVEVTAEPIQYHGKVALLVIFHDISGRKRVESALHEGEEKYRNVVERANDGIVILQDGIVKYANPRLAQMGGWSVDEVIGTPITNYIHPDDQSRVLEYYRKRMAGEEMASSYEAVLMRKNKGKVFAELNAGSIPYSGGIADLVIVRDITDRKEAQDLQAAVYRIALATLTTRSLSDLFLKIHEIITSVMPAENFYITLYDEKRQALRFPYFKDAFDEPYMGEIKPGQGLTAYVLRTGKSLLCTQAVHDELERQGAVKLLGVPSAIWLGVPLTIEEKTIGAMVVQHYSDPEAYGEREQHMLEFVSSQVAIAINRKQADDALQRQLKELAVLHNVSVCATQASSVDQLIEQVTKIIGDTVYVEDFGIALLDAKTNTLQPHPSYRGESFNPRMLFHSQRGLWAMWLPPVNLIVRRILEIVHFTSQQYQIRSQNCVFR